jgi:WS/DGAT/MGAT family acyltransferase
MQLPAPEAPWSPRGYGLRRHLGAMAREQVDRAQKLMVEGTLRALDTSPRRAAEDLRSATELLGELARNRPQAPMTPLNAPIGPNRRFATASVPLPTVKAAGKVAGATVNDVVLAAVAGTLRRYLAAGGVDLGGRAPVALVPVSVRRDDERDAGGNRISTVFVDLPVGSEELDERIRQVSATMRELRDSAAVRAGSLIAGATGQVPPLVSSVLVRAIGNLRAMNLVVSNVPGPQQPFFINGTRLREVYPAVPLNPANQGLAVGILSYDGMVFAGLVGDARLDPPLELAAQALQDEFDALAA